MIELNNDYWNKHYDDGKIPGWDIGYASPALIAYCDELKNKEIKILIPGAGNAWEAEELYKKGFSNVFIVEYAQKAIDNFIERFPEFPQKQIINNDFFTVSGQYDLILEQTFFTSLPRNMRTTYAKQICNLLKPSGKFVGLLFNHDFEGKYPPYGADYKEYISLFSSYFEIKTFEQAQNSIKPRMGKEFFFILKKENS